MEKAKLNWYIFREVLINGVNLDWKYRRTKTYLLSYYLSRRP